MKLPCFQHYRQEYFASVKVFKKRSFFFLTYIYPQYSIYYSCTLRLMYKTDYIRTQQIFIGPIRANKWSVRIFFGIGWEVVSSPVIYWNVQVINLRKNRKKNTWVIPNEFTFSNFFFFLIQNSCVFVANFSLSYFVETFFHRLLR